MSISADEWTKHFVDQAARKQGTYKPVYKLSKKPSENIKIVSPSAQSTDMARLNLKRARSVGPMRKNNKETKKLQSKIKRKKPVKKKHAGQIKRKSKKRIMKRKR